MLTQYRTSIILGVVIGIGFALSFGLGFIVNGYALSPEIGTQAQESVERFKLLQEVYELVDHTYLRSLPEDPKMEYGSIRGMLEILGDPTTLFIEPPVAQGEADALAGTYGGIGVQVRRLESGEFAVYPYQDSPAAREGLQDNDILVGINDIAIELDMQIDVINQMLRGEVIDNNGVNLRIERSDDDSLEVFVPFEVINVPSVTFRITSEDNHIGYIQILRFTNRTPDEVNDAATNLHENDIQGLILDLRNNSGGLLIESIEVADQFLSEGVIAVEQSQDSRDVFTAEAGSIVDETIPIVVLVNKGTASASELVAGALQDNGRGVLIGQSTYGKGTVQQIFPLSDGSSVHITSAEWLTPNESAIASIGLTPDVVMIPDENGRDVEFGEAIRYLTTILNKQSR